MLLVLLLLLLAVCVVCSGIGRPWPSSPAARSALDAFLYNVIQRVALRTLTAWS